MADRIFHLESELQNNPEVAAPEALGRSAQQSICGARPRGNLPKLVKRGEHQSEVAYHPDLGRPQSLFYPQWSGSIS